MASSKSIYVVSSSSSATHLSSSYITLDSYSGYPNGKCWRYPTSGDYYYVQCLIAKSVPTSYSSDNRSANFDVYTTLGNVCSALGIDIGYVTNVSVDAYYSNCTNTSKYYSPTLTNDVNAEYQQLQLYIGSSVTTDTPSYTYTSYYQNVNVSTGFYSSLLIGSNTSYRTYGGVSSSAGEGIALTSMLITVTYNECTTSINSASVSGYSVMSSNRSITSSDCKYTVNGSAYSSYCSSSSILWRDTYNGEDITTSSGSQTFYMHYPTVKLVFYAYGNGSLKDSSYTATVTASPTITISLSYNCNSVTINYDSIDTSAPYTYRYKLYNSSQSLILTYDTSSSSYTFSGLTASTQYYASLDILYGSTTIKSGTLKSFTTYAASVSFAIEYTYCTAVKVTGSESCGNSVYYYQKSGSSSYTRVYPDSSGYIYSLTPDTTYTFKCQSSAYSSVYKEITTTTTTQLTFTVANSTSDREISYPQRLSYSATSSTCTQTPTVQYSTNQTNWTTTTAGYVDVYNIGDTYIRAYLLINGTMYQTKTIKITLNSPTNKNCRIWRSGGSKYYVESGSSNNVYANTICYDAVCNYDSSSILSKTYSYIVDSGTAQTTSYGSFSATTGNSYHATGTINYRYYNSSTSSYTTVYSYTFYVDFTTIQFTSGNIFARYSNGNVQLNSQSTPTLAATCTAGEEIYIYANGWGTGTLSYNFSAYTTSTPSDQTSWTTLTDANGSFTSYGTAYSTATLIQYNKDLYYGIKYTISSTDAVGVTQSTNSNVLCLGYLASRIGIVADVTLTPEPAVGKLNETEFEADCTNSFVRGYSTADITASWALYRSSDVDHTNDLWNDTSSGLVDTTYPSTTPSTAKTAKDVKFKIKANGDYDLVLTLNGTYSNTALPTTTWESTIGIKEIIETGISDSNRFALLVFNSEKCFIASRSNVPYMTNLKFNKSIGNIGSLTCSITGANRVRMTDNTTVSELLTTAGTYVCLLDRMNPIWIGILTNPAELDTNYYDKSTQVSMFNITAYECTKELSTQYLPNTDKGLISGTLTSVVQKIIPTEHQGQIGTSSVNYGVSLSNTSRLTALDQLYNQCGWRYRCRPDTELFWKDVSASYTLTNCVVPIADMSDVPAAGDLMIFYANGKYGCAFVGSVASATGSVSYTINYGGSFKLPELSSTVRLTMIKSYLIDFKPTYYQTYNTRTWTVNKDATDANVTPNIRDQFGTAIVYGVGYSGETIASKMRAWMKINKDYTIDNAMRITRSYDSEIDTVVKLDDVTVGADTYARYTITFNGWSFPLEQTLTRLAGASVPVKPTIYFVNENQQLYSINIEYPSALPSLGSGVSNPRRYYDQGNNKKCAYTIGVKVGELCGDNITKKTSVIESLVQLSNVSFNVFAVDKFTKVPAVGSSLCVGDTICTVAAVNSQYSEVTVTYSAPTTGWEQNGIPHGHMTDVLVMDNSQTYNYSNPEVDSPYANFPDTSLTVQGPEGYSMMEMERLACRYMQYGSNYSAQCKATISAPFFYRDDFEIGAARLPMVGDRIAVKKMEDNGYVTNVYELQTYEFDYDNFKVKITFGMPFLNIGEVIYNMLSNSGLSMIPADS